MPLPLAVHWRHHRPTLALRWALLVPLVPSLGAHVGGMTPSLSFIDLVVRRGGWGEPLQQC